MDSSANIIIQGSLNPINTSKIIPISVKLQAIEYAEKKTEIILQLLLMMLIELLLYIGGTTKMHIITPIIQKKESLSIKKKALYFLISKINNMIFLNLIGNLKIVLQQPH